MSSDKPQKVRVVCPKCGHKFPTKSLILVSCNICGAKFKRDQNLAGEGK